MKIPSDCDPLAWGERRYVQPVMKGAGGNKGIANESYPYSFKMEVDGTSNNGRAVWRAFDVDASTDWAAYPAGDYYATMTFEYPLRIVGLQMLLGTWRKPTFNLYGISEGEDPVTEGTLLGGFTAASTSTKQYQCLATTNREYYRQYRIDFHNTGDWNNVCDIRLDAYYRPADLQG